MITVFCARSSRPNRIIIHRYSDSDTIGDVRRIFFNDLFGRGYKVSSIQKMARFWECDFNLNKTIRRDIGLSQTLKEAEICCGQYFVFSEPDEWTSPWGTSSYMNKMTKLRHEIYKNPQKLSTRELGQLFTMEAFVIHLFKTQDISEEERHAGRLAFLSYRLICQDVNLALSSSNRMWKFFWPRLNIKEDVLNYQKERFVDTKIKHIQWEMNSINIDLKRDNYYIEEYSGRVKQYEDQKKDHLKRLTECEEKLESYKKLKME